MAFLAKEILGLMCMPLSIAGILMFAGVAMLVATGRQVLGKIVVSLGVIVALGAAWAPLADRLLSPLETRHAPLVLSEVPPGVRQIVVLGGGHVSDARLPDTGRLSGSSLARLAEGIRLHRLLEDSRLVFTGAAVFDPEPHARVMARAAVDLGVDGDRIMVLERAKDTVEEVLALRETLGREPFVLVTSASHMPRAVLLFQTAGLHPMPAPADFLVKQGEGRHPGRYFPSAGALRRTERAVHEYLGLMWAGVYETGRLR